MREKLHKIFIVFEIIAFEFVAGILSVMRRIHVIARQSFNNSPKIFDLIQRHVFQLNISWINVKLG